MRVGSWVPLLCCSLGIYLSAAQPVPANQYHGDREREEFLLDVHYRCPGISRVYSVGESVQGRKLLAIEIFSTRIPTPRIVVPGVRLIGNIHGDETVGHEILLMLSDHLCRRYIAGDKTIVDLINTVNIHILPTMNPDGFNHTFALLKNEPTKQWCDYMHNEGYTAATFKVRQNSNGCDLNYNFPSRFGKENKFQAGCGIQKETQAIIDWAKAGGFMLGLNFQAGDHVMVSYPYDDLPNGMTMYSKSPDDDVFQYLAHLYASNMKELPVQCSSDANDPIPASKKYDSGVTNGAEYFTQHGTMQDWLYQHTSSLELTVSVSCCRHPPVAELQRWWAQHQPALLALLTRGLSSGIRGVVSELVPSRARRGANPPGHAAKGHHVASSAERRNGSVLGHEVREKVAHGKLGKLENTTAAKKPKNVKQDNRVDHQRKNLVSSTSTIPPVSPTMSTQKPKDIHPKTIGTAHQVFPSDKVDVIDSMFTDGESLKVDYAMSSTTLPTKSLVSLAGHTTEDIIAHQVFPTDQDLEEFIPDEESSSFTDDSESLINDQAMSSTTFSTTSLVLLASHTTEDITAHQIFPTDEGLDLLDSETFTPDEESSSLATDLGGLNLVPVSGARVQILGISKDIFAGVYGDYFRILTPGRNYTVIVSANGYKEIREEVFVSTNGLVTLNFNLKRNTENSADPTLSSVSVVSPTSSEVQPARSTSLSRETSIRPASTETSIQPVGTETSIQPTAEGPSQIVDSHDYTWAYHTYNEIETKLHEYASFFPHLTHLFSIGESREGRQLWAIKLTNNNTRSVRGIQALKPKVLLMAGIHGNEALGQELLLRLIDHLLKGHKIDPDIARILDDSMVYMVPTFNPDGKARNSRFNSNGVDLKYNYPDQNCGHPHEIEPETQSFMAWSLNEQFSLSLGLYGDTLGVIYPFSSSKKMNCSREADSGTSTPTPENELFQSLAKSYATQHSLMPKYSPQCDGEEPKFVDGVSNSALWYQQKGSLQDWHYWAAGTLDLAVHLGCNPVPNISTLAQEWILNKAALLDFLQEAQQGIKGVVVDALGYPVPACVVRVNSHATKANSLGEYFRILLPGVYQVDFVDLESGGVNVSTVEVLPLHDPRGHLVQARALTVVLALPLTRQAVGWGSFVLITVGVLGVLAAVLYTSCRAVVYYCQGFRQLPNASLAERGHVHIATQEDLESGGEEADETRQLGGKSFSDNDSDETDTDDEEDLFVNSAGAGSVRLREINRGLSGVDGSI